MIDLRPITRMFANRKVLKVVVVGLVVIVICVGFSYTISLADAEKVIEAVDFTNNVEVIKEGAKFILK